MRQQSVLHYAITSRRMNTDLTNLLPQERQRALSREYFLRLSVVVLVAITTLIAVAGLLLLPSYVLLIQEVATKEARLASIESTRSSGDEKTFSARLAGLSSDVAVLSALAGAPSGSTVIRNMLTISRPGITLSSFVFTPAAGKNPGTLGISGTAATRNALRAYQLALQSDPFATAANLPVSAYASDANIAFTITMTLSP